MEEEFISSTSGYYNSNPIPSLIIGSGSITCPGNLYIQGQIIQGPAPTVEPDYSREWAIRQVAKLTKAEIEISQLKHHISLLNSKIDSLKREG